MKRITVETGSGWNKYKSETPIAPGDYFVYPGKPAEIAKRQLALVATEPPPSARLGRFCWLAPAAEWVGWVLAGGVFLPELSLYKGEPVPKVWRLLDFDPTSLRPWQRRFVEEAFLALSSGYNYRRAAIVSLGGGKTLVGLLLCKLGEQSVVVAPRHVHSTWRDQAEQWKLPCPIVTTPESAHRITGPLDVVVVDEVLCAKDSGSLRSNKIRALSERASVVVGLTGTPTSGGGPLDWRWLDAIRPGCVPRDEKPWRFLFSDRTEAKEVAAGRKAYVTPPDSWDTKRIAAFVAPHLVRVDTSELLSHLPPIEFRKLVLPCPADYALIRSGAASEKGRSKVLTQARTCSDGFIYDDQLQPVWVHKNKINAAVEFVEGLGEPIIVVAAWRETITELSKALGSFNPAVVSGDTMDVGGQLYKFTSDQTPILILNARYGTGINGLQGRARVLLFLSWSTNPTDRKQMIGRVYRPGQDRGVIVVDLMCENTLDARCIELLDGHEGLSQAMIEQILSEEL